MPDIYYFLTGGLLVLATLLLASGIVVFTAIVGGYMVFQARKSYGEQFLGFMQSKGKASIIDPFATDAPAGVAARTGSYDAVDKVPIPQSIIDMNRRALQKQHDDIARAVKGVEE